MRGFYRAVFALYPVLALAGDKIVTVDPVGRWDAVGITRVTYGNSPVHCRLILNRTTVDTVEPFYSGEDWLKDVTIYILNRTDKTIVQGYFSLRFPETGDGTHEHPMSSSNLTFGRLPDAVAFNSRTGLPLQQDPKRTPTALYPGQTMAIRLSDYAEQIKIDLKQTAVSFATVAKCDIGEGSYTFSDGMRWTLGSGYSVPDVDNRGKYKRISDQEYFPGTAAWPPGYHK